MEFPCAIVRSGGVYAERNPDRSLLGWALQTLKAGKEITAYADIFNTPTFIGDLLKALVHIGEHKLEGIFHLGGASRESRYSFFKTFARIFELPTELIKTARYAPLPDTARLPSDISLNSESSYQMLGERFLTAEEIFVSSCKSTRDVRQRT